MELLNSFLSTFGPLSTLTFSAVTLIVCSLTFRAFWHFYQKGRLTSQSKTKKTYVLSIEKTTSTGSNPSFRNLKESTPLHRSKEMRRAPRYNLDCEVDFIMDGRLFKETSKDISHSGIFLKSKSPKKYNLGKKVMLAFQLPNEGHHKCKGYIVREGKNGVGIQFVA